MYWSLKTILSHRQLKYWKMNYPKSTTMNFALILVSKMEHFYWQKLWSRNLIFVLTSVVNWISNNNLRTSTQIPIESEKSIISWSPQKNFEWIVRYFIYKMNYLLLVANYISVWNICNISISYYIQLEEKWVSRFIKERTNYLARFQRKGISMKIV